MSVAVVQFPGSNCENETCEILSELNIPHAILPWNHSGSLDEYSGFVLPGGFSFQDRIRAGVIAAKLPILTDIKHQSDEYKKPVLGICNGAQILVESGFLSAEELNEIIDVNYVQDQRIGFLCDWGFLTPFNSQKNHFLNHLNDSDILPIQICHGEGRFLFEKTPVAGLKYTTIDGHQNSAFPTTPNGANGGVAAMSNDEGNVLAIMPHPERSTSISRTPLSIRAYAKRNNLNLVDFSRLFEAFRI